MGIKILSSQNQISLPETEDSGAVLHKKWRLPPPFLSQTPE